MSENPAAQKKFRGQRIACAVQVRQICPSDEPVAPGLCRSLRTWSQWFWNPMRAARIESQGGQPRMPQRLRYGKAFPEGLHALFELGKVINESGLEPALVELVKTRASQMNECAYCIDMHTKDARAAGETEQRLYALSAWRETSF